MEPINELTRHTLHLAFTDETGAPVIPASIRWKLDAINGSQTTAVQAETVVVPIAASHDLVIPAGLNRVVTTGAEIENMRVTVIADDLAAAEYTYRIRRLKGLD